MLQVLVQAKTGQARATCHSQCSCSSSQRASTSSLQPNTVSAAKHAAASSSCAARLTNRKPMPSCGSSTPWVGSDLRERRSSRPLLRSAVCESSYGSALRPPMQQLIGGTAKGSSKWDAGSEAPCLMNMSGRRDTSATYRGACSCFSSSSNPCAAAGDNTAAAAGCDMLADYR